MIYHEDCGAQCILRMTLTKISFFEWKLKSTDGQRISAVQMSSEY